MTLFRHISNGLHIQPGEGRRVVWCFLHAFLGGAAMELAYTSAATLFLQHFSPGHLPWVYVAIAVVGSAATAWVTRLQARASLSRFLCGLLLLTAAGLVILRLGNSIANWRGWIFALLIWGEVGYRLIRIESNLLVAELFDIRQSKRLFGLIEAGSFCAQIAAGIALAFLAAHFEVANMFYLSAAMLCAAMLIVLFILKPRQDSTTQETPPAPHTQQEDSWIALLRRRHVRLAAAALSLFVCAYYLVDNAFYMEVAARFPDEASMAAFLGGTSAVAGLLALLCLTLLSRRLLTRFGLLAGLLLLPVSLLIPATVMSTLPVGHIWIFWLAVALQITRDIFYASSTVPSEAIVLQPLPPAIRTRVQSILTGIINPLVSGLCGIGLLLLFQFAGAGTVDLTRILICIAILWIIVSFRLQHEYVAELQKAISRRRLAGAGIQLNDPSTITIILASLQGANPAQIIHGLDLLQEAGYKAMESILVQLLDHMEPQIRREAVRRLGTLDPKPSSEPLQRRFAAETHPAVRATFLHTLIRIEQPDAVSTLAVHMDSPDSAIQQSVITALLHRPDCATFPSARQHLRQWAQSKNPSDRKRAADVFSSTLFDDDQPLLAALLLDENHAVRYAAIEAATMHPAPAFTEPLLACVTLRGLRRITCAALAATGPAVIPSVATLLSAPDVDLPLAYRLTRLLGQLGTPESIRVLLPLIGNPRERIRHAALEGLALLSAATPLPHAPLTTALLRERQEAAWLCACEDDLGHDPDNAMLHRAIERLHTRQRDRILLLLSCMFPSGPVQNARRYWNDASAEKRAMALEILDSTLSAELRATVSELLEPMPLEQRSTRLRATHPQPILRPDQRLKELATGREDWQSNWVQACAMHRIKLAHGSTFTLESQVRMLSIVERVLILKTVSIFADIPDEELAALAAQLAEVEVPAGTPIIRYGECGTTLYIVVSGQVRVHLDDRQLTVLGERAVFGEFSALDPEPRSASVTALDDVTLFSLDQQVLYELLEDNPAVSHGIIKALVGIIRQRNAGK